MWYRNKNLTGKKNIYFIGKQSVSECHCKNYFTSYWWLAWGQLKKKTGKRIQTDIHDCLLPMLINTKGPNISRSIMTKTLSPVTRKKKTSMQTYLHKLSPFINQPTILQCIHYEWEAIGYAGWKLKKIYSPKIIITDKIIE